MPSFSRTRRMPSAPCFPLLFALLATPLLARADDPRVRSTHYVGTFFGQSALILGSRDIRTGGGFSLGYGKPEKRFSLKKIPAQLVYEGYVDWTRGNGRNDHPVSPETAFGVLGFSRWRWPTHVGGWGAYADFGWGLQFADRTSFDLESQLNSTPMAGIGGVYQFGSQELLVGVRLLHISNAGTRPPNQGQNQLFFTASIRY